MSSGKSISYSALARFYDQLMEDIDYGSWVQFITDEFTKAGIEPGSRVLDLACGTGTVTTELASRGFSMTGVDLSETMLAVAEEKCRRQGTKALWLQQDLRDLSLPVTYDAVLCLCDGINHLLHPSEVQRLFRRIFGLLRPGGIFIFDVNSLDKLEKVYGDNVYADHHPGFSYIWENRWDERAMLCEMDIALFVQRHNGLYERFDETYAERAYSNEELSKWLTLAGFDLLRLSAGYGGEERRERWVFSARHP